MLKPLSLPKILILPSQHPNTVNYELFCFFQAFYQIELHVINKSFITYWHLCTSFRSILSAGVNISDLFRYHTVQKILSSPQPDDYRYLLICRSYETKLHTHKII